MRRTTASLKRILGIFLITAAIAVPAAIVQAQDTDERGPDKTAPAEPAEEAPNPLPLGSVVPGLGFVDQQAVKLRNWGAQYGLTIGMAIDFSYQYGFTKPHNSKLSLRLLDKDHDNFGLDYYQFTLAKMTPEPGDWGFMFQPIAGRFARRMKSDWDGSGVFQDTHWEDIEFEFQQGYLAYNVPVGNGVQLKLGKFNTLVGSEVNEPWLNPTYSKQNVYALAQPATHTGGLASYAFNPVVAVTVGGITGWDVVEDNNAQPSFIGQIALTPRPEANIFLNWIYGPEQAKHSGNKRSLLDVVTLFKPVEGLLLLQNFDYGTEDGADPSPAGDSATFWGISNTIAYDFTPRWTGAFRQEWFDDEDGARTGIAQGIWELTFDLKFKVSDFLYVRTEYRHDESNRRPFLHKVSGQLPGQDSVAVELGYFF